MQGRQKKKSSHRPGITVIFNDVYEVVSEDLCLNKSPMMLQPGLGFALAQVRPCVAVSRHNIFCIVVADLCTFLLTTTYQRRGYRPLEGTS